jgi:ADP-ribosyl-[dinitrogen reductase] hydrolase
MSIKDRFTGCLVGLACGDYLGMPVEFQTSINVKEFFGIEGVRPIAAKDRGDKPPGYYTDDTSMTICFGESLVRGFNIKDQFETYRKWFYEGYATPDNGKPFGVGQRTLIALTRQTIENLPTKLEHNEKHGGNGALMRTAPIGLLYYKDPKMLVEASIKSTIVTHNNSASAWSCVALNKLISYAITGLPKGKMRTKLVSELTGDCPSELRDLIAKLNETKELQNSGYSLDTLRIAFHSFFNTKSYQECINEAICFGGDTDTQAAVAGALAGSYYGYKAIPEGWRELLMRREYIEDLAEKLYKEATKTHPPLH